MILGNEWRRIVAYLDGLGRGWVDAVPYGDDIRAATAGMDFQKRVVRKGIVMAGKYTPLENYLRDLPATQKEVSLSFEQIEGILKFKLPSSAYEDERWWWREKEGNHVNLRAWTSAGWKIESIDVNKKLARLVRV